MSRLRIDPPLLNSASPWATTEEDIQQLFDCSHTGAITTRTSLLEGFKHDDAVHQYTYFKSDSLDIPMESSYSAGMASLNSLGYSPIPLREYLEIVARVIKNSSLPEEIRQRKPCIISVTGGVEEVVECYHLISNKQANMPDQRLFMEVNLSCPNIPDKPPPAYSKSSLEAYLRALHQVKCTVLIGLKVPPYTYDDQFRTLTNAIEGSGSDTIDFITTTNTLGSSLVLDSSRSPAIRSASGTGIGGMAGVPLHPLALGNVSTLRSMLDANKSLIHIAIIGVGGVYDRAGFDRMVAVGAEAVAVATALGAQGIDVFGRIICD